MGGHCPSAHVPKSCRAEVGEAPAPRGKSPSRWEKIQSPKVGIGKEQLQGKEKYLCVLAPLLFPLYPLMLGREMDLQEGI